MKSFLKGFVYAGKGVFSCLKNERNMRVHLCFTVYMFAFLTYFDFFKINRTEFAVLLALCALVLSLEAVNTAIENTIDLITSEHHPLAAIAKDAAAGAVLISAVFSIFAGIAIMYQPDAFRAMFAYYSEHIGMLVLLGISLIFSLAFVFLPGRSKKKGSNSEDKQ